MMVKRKILAILAALAASVAMSFTTAAWASASSHHLAARATATGSDVGHIAAVPATGFAGDRVCDLASPTLCMSGFDGEGAPITGVTSGDAAHLNMDEFVVTQSCNNGKVSDGAAGQGPPCPFKSGTGLNKEFDNDSIVELANAANGMNYAAFEEPAGWGVIEEHNGDGQLWVQVGDLSGLSPNAIFVNVLASDSNGQETIICTAGSGHQLPVNIETGSQPANCRWFNAGPA